MTRQNMAGTDNYILARLPREEYQTLKSWIEPVEFKGGDFLAYAGRGMEYFYFITDGIVSLSSATSHGESIEVAMVGREGTVGLCALFEEKAVALDTSAQNGGVRAQRISINKLKQLQEDCPALRRFLYAFMFKQMMQISQNLVCSHFHTIEQQLCKWILLRDRRLNGVLHVTQDKIAQMLGVRRAGINAVIRRLQNEGLIDCQRGIIKVADRLRLNDMACECYTKIQSEYDRPFHTDVPESA